jgi:hypothetical protein
MPMMLQRLALVQEQVQVQQEVLLPVGDNSGMCWSSLPLSYRWLNFNTDRQRGLVESLKPKEIDFEYRDLIDLAFDSCFPEHHEFLAAFYRREGGQLCQHASVEAIEGMDKKLRKYLQDLWEIWNYERCRKWPSFALGGHVRCSLCGGPLPRGGFHRYVDPEDGDKFHVCSECETDMCLLHSGDFE